MYLFIVSVDFSFNHSPVPLEDNKVHRAATVTVASLYHSYNRGGDEQQQAGGFNPDAQFKPGGPGSNLPYANAAYQSDVPTAKAPAHNRYDMGNPTEPRDSRDRYYEVDPVSPYRRPPMIPTTAPQRKGENSRQSGHDDDMFDDPYDH